MKVSVAFSTYNRAHLLENALIGYDRQTLPKDEFEIIVIDDDSTDHTHKLCMDWQNKLPIVYIKVKKPQGVEWRDCSSTLNLGIRAAKGETVIITHPEVIPGFGSLAKVHDACSYFKYVSCKPYYLDQNNTERMEYVDWQTQGLQAVKSLPGFYDQTSAEVTGNQDYTHQAIEKKEKWESWVFGGMSRDTWREIGGLTESPVWGVVDVTFFRRRNALGIETVTLQDEDTYCIHPWHDSPRNVKKAIEKSREVLDYDDAREANL